ncbi:MAG: FtsX-like permease family protein, partial [Pseudomonadota bacterium]
MSPPDDHRNFMKKISLALKLLRRNAHAIDVKVLLVALVIAVASVTTVAFFTDRVWSAIKRQANELIAADVIIKSTEPIDGRFKVEAERLQLKTVDVVSFPSMVAGDEAKGQGVSLSELKAVTSGFPLRGKIRIADSLGQPDHEAETIPLQGTVWVAPTLLSRINLRVGDQLKVGAKNLQVAKILTKESDAVLDYFGVIPRVLLNHADLDATKLIQVGSRSSYSLLVAGDTAQVSEFSSTFKGKLKTGERLETIRNAGSEVGAALERADTLLGLAALLSVVLAAVAIALAARRFSQRQLDSAAMMRCLGASQADIFTLNFLQFMVLGITACVLGTIAGFGAQQGLVALLTSFFKGALPTPTVIPALQGFGVGMVLLLGFTLPPLLSLRKVSTLRVLRRDLDPFDGVAVVAYLLGFVTLSVLIIWRAGDIKLGGIAVGGFSVMLAVAALVGYGMIQFAASLRGAASGSWRYGIANMKRRSGASLVQIVALGLGIMAMLLLTLVRTDFISRWQSNVNENSANRFVINIQSHQLDDVRTYFAAQNLATPELYPMVRGRLVAISDVAMPARPRNGGSGNFGGAREFNLSWTDKLQDGNKIVAGQFWDATDTVPQFSLEEGIAKSY